MATKTKTKQAEKSAEPKGNAKPAKPVKATKEFAQNGKPFVMIMAGGSGTRLWPMSRVNRPKQLINIVGKKTLIEEAVERARLLTTPDRIYIGTNKDLAAKIQKIVKLDKKQYLLEPEARNTAPIIAYFTSFLKQHGADDASGVVILAADHHIEPAEKWAETVKLALTRAGERIWCMGIKPTRAETGYGYIEAGIEVAPRMSAISSFREKPDYQTASHYLTTERHYWNSGMFIFSLGRMREDLRIYQAEMLKLADACAQTPANLAKSFAKMQNISIDYAIMEKTKKVGLIQADFLWDDVGSFEALGRIYPVNESGNHVISGKVISHRAKGNIVKTGLTIALLGLDNCVLVEDNGVLLIAKRDALPEIKELREKAPKELL
ncbi:MAG TPA: mannose-1-phosphate guanylyltransferase [Turneriella sp.]|nr:mannose-1-phosphate guanylyltransferase [Turneriella sp.]HNA79743.1 mannose-1-phosphate guanylyltransferase [Turneriella sp.]HNE18400.1 mannose-1-phosphate guanylyltransferase [Turneriella sp.]HNJ65197.1 mannose-1-phosphate guanylyltransferase [Turneriella sp.]HNL53006.1 mannose-1-phosphate guanylyltransferase [Turneriella sp.]